MRTDRPQKQGLNLRTAAQHATRRVPVVAPDRMAGDARAHLAGQRYDIASHILVCDGERFQGLIRIEDLLAASDETPVADFMDRDPPVVAPGVDQEIAAWRAARRGESALAVVDEQRRFVGMIPPHRLIAVLLAAHEEDLTHLGGFTRHDDPSRSSSEEPVRRRFWHRLPWVLVGLVGALLAANVVAHYEDQLRNHVMLAFFVPAIVYLADAVGTQTETIVVRGLSLGVPMRRMIGRELLVGAVMGVVLGALAAPAVWWQWERADVALTVGLSVFAACATAAVAALSMPWLLRSLKFDPAFGSGPLSTAIQDLLSLLIYFAIAAAVVK